MQNCQKIAIGSAIVQNGELIEEGSVLDIFSVRKCNDARLYPQFATGIEAMVKINQQRL